MEYLWYAIFYSFFGYCLEKLFAALTHARHRLRRCFVALPLCPVYGLAMLAVLLSGAETLPRAWEQFLLGVLAATVVEYAVHWGYEKAFAVQFWDYSHTKCDVNGRVCLPFSLCWGVLAMLAVRYVQPFLARLAALLPETLLPPVLFFIMLDGIFAARMLLLTHDIDALTPRTLLQTLKRRAA